MYELSGLCVCLFSRVKSLGFSLESFCQTTIRTVNNTVMQYNIII